MKHGPNKNQKSELDQKIAAFFKQSATVQADRRKHEYFQKPSAVAHAKKRSAEYKRKLKRILKERRRYFASAIVPKCPGHYKDHIRELLAGGVSAFFQSRPSRARGLKQKRKSLDQRRAKSRPIKVRPKNRAGTVE